MMRATLIVDVTLRSPSGIVAWRGPHARRSGMGLVQNPLSLSASGTYTIRVQGPLDATWSEQLGGLRITGHGTGRHAVTILVGRLTDQAALMGVLNTLYELGFPLLSVEYVSPS
jgi:hypothetical protein